MKNAIKTAALAAFLGLGALVSAPAAAEADGLYLNFGRQHDSRFGIYAGDRDARHEWRRDRHRRHACTARQALGKARHMGVRRARIADEGRRTIKVAGRSHDGRVVIVFRRAPGCPIVRR